MGKPQAPAPPPYEQMLELSERLQTRNLDLTEEMLRRSMADADKLQGRASEFWQLQKPEIAQQFEMSSLQRERYRQFGIPAEDRLADELAGYASPERLSRDQASARQEVALSAEAQRRQAASRLASLGLDPSQMVASGLDRRLSVLTAGQEAMAGTAAAREFDNQKLGRLADRANLFRTFNEIGAQASDAGRRAFGAGQEATGAAAQFRQNASGQASSMIGQSAQITQNAFNVANGIYGNQIRAWETQMQNSPAAIFGGVLGTLTGRFF